MITMCNYSIIICIILIKRTVIAINNVSDTDELCLTLPRTK